MARYGSEFSDLSAYNEFTSTPPRIIYQGRAVGPTAQTERLATSHGLRKQLGITVRPHDFRHALACRLLNNGAAMSQVSKAAGTS